MQIVSEAPYQSSIITFQQNILACRSLVTAADSHRKSGASLRRSRGDFVVV